MSIVHVMGLPGAGKSTLTETLGARLGWSVTSIGEHREGTSSDRLGEMEAWLGLYRHLLDRGWQRTLVETSGLNGRACLLRPGLGPGRLYRIKLTCEVDVLHERVAQREARRASKDGSTWAFEASIPDRHAFIDRFAGSFDALAAEIQVDTTQRQPGDVLEEVSRQLGRLGVLPGPGGDS